MAVRFLFNINVTYKCHTIHHFVKNNLEQKNSIMIQLFNEIIKILPGRVKKAQAKCMVYSLEKNMGS